MATGGYTVDNESFCRLYRFVCEIVPKPIRRLLECNSPNGNVQLLLGNSNTQIQIMRTKGILQKHQLDILNPPPGKTFDLNNWDVTLLCSIAKNVCKINNRSIKTALDDLRNERNKLSHCSSPELTIADFNIRWTAVENSLNVITYSLNDQSFQKAITDEYSNVKTGPISVQPIFDLFKTHLQATDIVKASVDDLGKDIKEMNKDVKELRNMYQIENQKPLRAFEEHAKEMEKNLETVKDAAIETRNFVKDIQSDLYSEIRKRPTPENTPKLPKRKPRTILQPRIKVLCNQTEKHLQTGSNYVMTEQFREAQKTLMTNNCVVICGGLGEGKTSTAFELMRRNKQNKTCIQIQTPDDIHCIEPNVFDFVLIDDIFGNYELDENKFQSWAAVLEKLQNSITSKAFKLILTTSEIAFNEGCSSLEKYSMFKSVVLLKTDKLETKEKQSILQQCLIANNRELSLEFIEKCVAAYKSSSGFPYLCFLFASDDTFFKEKEQFFLRKEVMDHDILSHFNKAKQLTLLYLWLKGGNCIELSDMPEKNCSLLEEISCRLGHSKDISTLCGEVKHNLDVMSGAFIQKRGDGYAFAHNSIYRTVGLFFARRGFHDMIISKSNIDFFMECIRIDDCYGNADYIVPRALYKYVVDRIINEVIRNKRCRAMAIHPCLTDEIVSLLFHKLIASSQLQTFLVSEKSDSASMIYYTTKDDSSGQFLFHLLKNTSSVSIPVLKAVIKDLKCRHFFRKQVSCILCKMFTNAFKGACRGGNLEALKLLSFVNVEASELVDAVFSNKKDVYQLVSSKMHGYKDRSELKMQCMQLSVILGHIEVFNQLIYDGIKPDIFCFRLAVRNKKYMLIEKILIHLSLSAEHEIISDMLQNLDCYEKYAALAQCGLLPSKADIKHSIDMFDERVKPILWDLKYAFKSQNKLYKKQKRNLWLELSGDSDTREIMIRYGLELTEDYLLKMSLVDDIERFKDTMQYLDKYEAWNPKDDLSERIVNSVLASRQSEYKIYKFLLARGFQPSPSTLHKTVLCKCGLDIVLLTVSKMKEFNSFDKTNPQIRQSMLESVYSPEIYNILESEGVDLLDTDVDEAFDRAFYKPDLFKCLTTKFNISNSKYALLKSVRESSLQKVQETFHYLETNTNWQPDDIVIQLSLLESDTNVCEFLSAHGVSCDDILDKAFKYNDDELVSYILSLAANTQYNLRISKYDHLTLNTLYLLARYNVSDKLRILERAIQLGNKNAIMSIVLLLEPFENTDLGSKEASNVLYESVRYKHVYLKLLNIGFVPDMACLYHTAHCNLSNAFYETICLLCRTNNFYERSQYVQSSMIAAIKHKNTNIVRNLVDCDIKPMIECLKYAVRTDKAMTNLVLEFIDPLELQVDSRDMTEIVNECLLNFPMYELLSSRGVKPNSANILRYAEIVIESSAGKSLRQNIYRVLIDYISGNKWVFTDTKMLQFEYLVNHHIPELSSVVKSEREKVEARFVISELEEQNEHVVLTMFSRGEIDPNGVLPKVLRWYCSSCTNLIEDGEINGILNFINESENCSVSLKLLSTILQRNSSYLPDLSSRYTIKSHDLCAQMALEMAIYFDQDNACSILLHKLNVQPTPYCLFTAIRKEKLGFVNEILKRMSFEEKQSPNAYFKLALASCVHKNNKDLFISILEETAVEIDTEIVFEAVLSKHTLMITNTKTNLEKRHKWDYYLKEYWISSAHIEAEGASSLVSCLEDYYDDAISTNDTRQEAVKNNSNDEMFTLGINENPVDDRSQHGSQDDGLSINSNSSDSATDYEEIV